MKKRYLFLCPDRTSASGGIAVIYDMVNLLNRIGYEVAIVHNNPSAGYHDYEHSVPAYYTRHVQKIYWQYASPRARIKMIRERFVNSNSRLQRLELRSDDVIVAPEYQMAEVIEAFPNQPIVIFVQNPFGLMSSYLRADKRGLQPNQSIAYWCGIADVCQRHLEILGAENVEYFPVSMKPEEFPYIDNKMDLITYMPRKRPGEAKIINESLRRRGKIGRYQLKALDGISRKEVSEYLGKSRFFISLLKQEALGFPAAEAMASGCIVIGFDGLGCEEYFNKKTGIPVTEGDVAGIIRAVEDAIAEYDKEPMRLDAMRRFASTIVNEKYSAQAFEVAVLAAWKKVDLCISKNYNI